MARVGEMDPRAEAVNTARRKLQSALERQIEPSFDMNELAQAISDFMDAKMVFALSPRIERERGSPDAYDQI